MNASLYKLSCTKKKTFFFLAPSRSIVKYSPACYKFTLVFGCTSSAVSRAEVKKKRYRDLRREDEEEEEKKKERSRHGKNEYLIVSLRCLFCFSLLCRRRKMLI